MNMSVQELHSSKDLTPEEQTLLARIPMLAGSSKKAAYLAYRSCGFTIMQSCQLAEVEHPTLSQWRKKDPTFRRFEREELARLQETLGNDIIRFEFMRNMRMLLKSDMNIISKGINGVEDLSVREYELFKALRKFYTPADMLSLEKILHPEKHKDTPITIQLTWGGRIESPLLTAPDVDAEFKDLPPDEDKDV